MTNQERTVIERVVSAATPSTLSCSEICKLERSMCCCTTMCRTPAETAFCSCAAVVTGVVSDCSRFRPTRCTRPLPCMYHDLQQTIFVVHLCTLGSRSQKPQTLSAFPIARPMLSCSKHLAVNKFWAARSRRSKINVDRGDAWPLLLSPCNTYSRMCYHPANQACTRAAHCSSSCVNVFAPKFHCRYGAGFQAHLDAQHQAAKLSKHT